MKRFLTFVVLLALAVSSFAQGNRYNYDSSEKYGFFSNWKISPFAQMSFLNSKHSAGAGVLALKQLSDWVYFRAEGSVNGIQANGFDRNGTALAGFQFHPVSWAYLYLTGGAVINPSMPQYAGLAGSGGGGFTCNFGKFSGLFAEGGYVAIQNGAKVDNMFQVRLGYIIRPGITKADKEQVNDKYRIANQLSNLSEENKALKADLKQKQIENDTLLAFQNNAVALLTRLEKKLNECNEQVTQVTAQRSIETNPIFQIFFDYASAEITSIEQSKLDQLARHIQANPGTYRLEGFSSSDGDPYRNEVLSGERARAVYYALIDLGVDEESIIPMQGGISQTYGPESPLNRMVVVSKSPY